MSIFAKIFGNEPAAPAPAPAAQPVQPGNLPANAGNTSDPNNPTVPANSTTSAESASPMDKFNEFWKNDTNATENQPQPLITVDPEKVAAAARNNDFTKVISPELKAQIEAGGADAMNAMLQVMQSMSQKSFGDSAIATSKIVEAALEKQMQKFQEMMPNLVKQQSLKDSLAADNPLFNHPATAPILESLQQQVARKFPNATLAEQKQMASEYLKSFAEAAAPKAPEVKSNNPADVDWSTFLN